jgi:hypothetical protein
VPGDARVTLRPEEGQRPSGIVWCIALCDCEWCARGLVPLNKVADPHRSPPWMHADASLVSPIDPS